MKSRTLTVLLILLSLFFGIIIPERVEAKEENEKKEVVNQINQIYFGQMSYYVLGRDGSLWSGGYNSFGRLGWAAGNNTDNKGELRRVRSAKNIIDFSADAFKINGLNNQGEIWEWFKYDPIKVIKYIKNVRTLVSGNLFVVALTEDGKVWTWGQNTYGELGLGDTSNRLQPTLVPGLDNVVEIASNALSKTVLALKSDGTVWGWGYTNDYQLGKSGEYSTIPTQINLPVRVKHIYQSSSTARPYSAAIDENNSVWWWGKDYPSEAKSPIYGEPVLDENIRDVKQLALGAKHVVALKNDGTVLAWGTNSAGQLGNGTKIDSLSPVPVPGLKDIHRVSAGDDMSGAVSNSSDVYIWGSFISMGSITSPKLITIDDQPSEVLPVEKPLSLKLKVISVNSVQLSWEHERQNDWDRYDIYQNNQMIQTTKDKTITIGNLDPNKEYNFYVTTKGILGQESEASNTVKKRGIEKYTYVYNSSGQLTSIIYESGKRISYEYDKNGNLKKTTVVNP
ncbi:RCC1 domain-containing protein [Paenibacillus polysaccharolyticus]|uniref:RCC1 domain-containing protein n=1 Tax=Paenibacillus polysaccharolyticus TaxID=582692 RepID=UPI00280BA607|nr:fibronectin type III domain-containing protein [Paenibacillus polysaccharolyticus]